jgi:sialic acid synthase SpsE
MSMEPADFAEMIDVLGRVRQGLGSGVKAPAASELEVRAVSRRSVVLARDLPRGTVLSRADLVLKRPGDGLAPARLPELIGRRLLRDMHADDAIRVEDVAP